MHLITFTWNLGDINVNCYYCHHHHDHHDHQSINQSINQSVSQPIKQPVKQSVRQSVNQSIKSIKMSPYGNCTGSTTRSYHPSMHAVGLDGLYYSSVTPQHVHSKNEVILNPTRSSALAVSLNLRFDARSCRITNIELLAP